MWIDARFGTILFAFFRSETELHQVIGPAIQLAHGYTNSLNWALSQGIYAENIPYFFASKDEQSFSGFMLRENGLVFSASEKNFHKSISIDGNHLTIAYQNPVQNQYVPLLLDPWQRFSPNWYKQYEGLINRELICWILKERVSVCTNQNGHINLHSFKDTEERFSSTEDPNLGNPLGHFLPFPMALIEISNTPSQSLHLELSISP